jgi:hypothetical protein
MGHASLPLVSLAVVFAAAASPAQMKGRVWSHPPLGVQITVPDDYSLVPLQVDEKWIVGKFLGDKTYISKDREWNQEHRPLMRVIAFTEAAKKGSGVEVQETEAGDTFIGIGAVPYQGYRDYVKRHRSGFFFSKEEKTKVNGQECLMCEVQVHKAEPKLRLFSIVFRRPAFELAVEFEVLEDRLDKLQTACRQSLESVRFTSGGGAVATGGTEKNVNGITAQTSSKLWRAFRAEWRKRPAKERDDIRRKIEADHHAAVRAKTPADWTVLETRRFLVVSHTEAGFTERMVQSAEAFFDWCENEFGSLSDDHVRRPVLRLCRDADEYHAYHFGSSGTTGWSLFGDDHEIGTYRDDYNGTSGRDSQYLFDGILHHFLQEKDTHIVNYAPHWLTWALDDYVRGGVVKDRKLEFRVDDWTRDEARNLHRENKLPALRTILELDADAFASLQKTESRAGYATAQALRFVLGPGQRDKAFKDFLRTYFKAVIAAADKRAPQWSQGASAAQTEEEEERLAKQDNDQMKARRKELQKEINAAAFGKVSDKQWEQLNRAFGDFVKAGK